MTEQELILHGQITEAVTGLMVRMKTVTADPTDNLIGLMKQINSLGDKHVPETLKRTARELQQVIAIFTSLHGAIEKLHVTLENHECVLDPYGRMVDCEGPIWCIGKKCHAYSFCESSDKDGWTGGKGLALVK